VAVLDFSNMPTLSPAFINKSECATAVLTVLAQTSVGITFQSSPMGNMLIGTQDCHKTRPLCPQFRTAKRRLRSNTGSWSYTNHTPPFRNQLRKRGQVSERKGYTLQKPIKKERAGVFRMPASYERGTPIHGDERDRSKKNQETTW
jgi:hypothetical protein